jgi:glycosyltransferase involved in cell wall biosynthesis
VTEPADLDALHATIDRQAFEIAQLRRPRHWRSTGVRGGQAQAWHEALDRAINTAVGLRALVRRRGRTDLPDQNRTQAAPERLEAVERVLRSPLGAGLDASAVGWLRFVAAVGRTPDVDELDRMGSIDPDVAARQPASESDRSLTVLTEQIVVDVTQTAREGNHTGIQRVVRELAAHWARRDDVTLVWWDDDRGVLRLLGADDIDRLVRPVTDEIRSVPVYDLDAGPADIVVPVRCTLVVPEVVPERGRILHHGELVRRGLVELAAVVYDTIPITAPETRADDDGWFTRYLGLVKLVRRAVAISATTAQEFQAFGAMLRSQGLEGPLVVPMPLPSDPPPHDPAEERSVRTELGIGAAPVVLVVGSTEPRKNHRAVLRAAEQLWSDGLEFQLVMVGGWGWRADGTYEDVRRLLDRGRRITFVGPCSDARLWASRGTVYPSQSRCRSRHR